MATKKMAMTWDKSKARWIKMYKGKVFYGKRGVLKSDDVAKRQAWSDYEQWRGMIDQPLGTYAETQRQRMANWYRLLGKEEDAQRLLSTPRDEWDDYFNMLPEGARNIWADRIATQQIIAPIDAEKTIAKAIDRHIAQRLKDAQGNQISHKRYGNITHWLTIFRDWIGTALETKDFQNTHLQSFKEHLLSLMIKDKYSSSYAHSILHEAKLFANWLFNFGYIDKPIYTKNITIAVGKTKDKILDIPVVKKLLTSADDELKLYILLGLNCGFTPIDISELKPNEVLWDKRRILRQRTKEEDEDNTPFVNYKLWDETARLLKMFKSKSRDRVLLNCRGKPLKEQCFKSATDTKLKHNDTIGKAMKLLTKNIKVKATHKQFRDTSANLITNEKRFRGDFYRELFLGHSIKSVSEKSYYDADDDTLDDAIAFLGKCYGVE